MPRRNRDSAKLGISCLLALRFYDGSGFRSETRAREALAEGLEVGKVQKPACKVVKVSMFRNGTSS